MLLVEDLTQSLIMIQPILYAYSFNGPPEVCSDLCRTVSYTVDDLCGLLLSLCTRTLYITDGISYYVDIIYTVASRILNCDQNGRSSNEQSQGLKVKKSRSCPQSGACHVIVSVKSCHTGIKASKSNSTLSNSYLMPTLATKSDSAESPKAEHVQLVRLVQTTSQNYFWLWRRSPIQVTCQIWLQHQCWWAIVSTWRITF